MNTEPSEHAMRAARKQYETLANIFFPGPDNEFYEKEAAIIDQHAIAPAVAEATVKLEQELNTAHAVGSSYAKELAEARREVAEQDKRIAELEEALQNTVEHCYDLRGEWGWKKDEPRAGNKSQYDRLCEVIANAETLLAKKGQP